MTIPSEPTDIRDSILSRVRAANAAAGIVPSSVDLADSDLSKLELDFDRVGTLKETDRIELFRRRLEEYDANVEVADDLNAKETVARLLAKRGGRIVRPTDFPDRWRPDGVDWIDGGSADFGTLDASAGVISTAVTAIAATGTIVLQHGAGQGRRAETLLPDYLLCIVEADQLVETVPEAVARLDPIRPTTFISGPSATADIEMTRIKGVHGPRFLDVVVVCP